MAEHWVENHKRDAWRRQAKASGYRARSAFKLKQIQERFQLVRSGDLVLDVGCHPGGWAQVAVELVGEEGRVVGVARWRSTERYPSADFAPRGPITV